MIFHFSGGGGTALNFKVVGNPQPENPSVNTLWVDTDVAITGWTFDAAAPESPAEGTVWFPVGTDGPVAFNALKKNSIMVYPLSAKQYVSGVWTSVPVQICQDSEWTSLWSGELYDAGNQYEDVTGGWVVGEGDATATIDDTGITLSTTSNSANRIHVETANAVDLSNHATLYALVNVSSISLGSGINSARVRLGYAASSGANLANSSTKVEKQVTATGEVTLQLDISEATGEFYIVVGIGFYSVKVKPEKIWME